MPVFNRLKSFFQRGEATTTPRASGLELRTLALETRQRMTQFVAFANAVDEALRQGNTQLAVQSCQEMRNDLEEVERRGGLAEPREFFGYGYFDLGINYLESGRFEDAEASFRKSLTRWTDLAISDPTQSWYRERIAACQNQIGIVYEWSGVLESSEASYNQALVIREDLQHLHPDAQDNVVYLGGVLCNLGNIARRRGATQAAEDFYDRSIQIFRSVIPPCDCGCQEALLHALSAANGYPHWILTAQNYLKNAQDGKAALAQVTSS